MFAFWFLVCHTFAVLCVTFPGDRVMSTTSISMDSAGDDEPLLRPSVLDCDNDDDDVSLLSS